MKRGHRVKTSHLRPQTSDQPQSTVGRGIGSLLFLTLCTATILSFAGCRTPGDRIVIGSKNFTEQVILGELLAQYVESGLHVDVERRLNLGGTFICHQAIQAGAIDMYVEYTGTAYTAILKHPPISDSNDVYQRVQSEYRSTFHLEWAEPLGFNNTFAIIIRGEDARALNLQTISQAARYAPQWRAGFGPEFMERADGFAGLANTYDLRFAEAPGIMDIGLMYKALTERQVDLVAGNSTDGLISSLGLAVLEDDRHYFPPYLAAPVVRQETLDRHPELRAILGQLGSFITEEEMRRLNYQVDGEHRDVKDVVAEFLQAHGVRLQ